MTDGDVAKETEGVTGTETTETGHAYATPGARGLISAIVRRELRTVARTRTFALLTAALAAILLGIGWAGGGMESGYVPTVVDVLTPLEVLVPVVAVVFGYRAILGDRERGELEVFRTYPISAWQLVLGTYLGRAIGVVLAVTVPLTLLFIGVVFTETERLRVYATHAGADSPVLFARLIVLAVVFALVVLAIAIAVSALVSSARTGLVAAALALLVVLFGLDLAIIYGFVAGPLGEASLIYALPLSPLSAFRGLVLETVIVTAAGTGPRAASPIASLFGLAAWTVGSLVVATLGVEHLE
ncbi:ABC transporter permease subunit [Natronosalvus amylolyticus]|uniref:ABC transporter permease subunit n=1 Tax=Natronosalvus amylolyticus TaxID=2961994 RepID=UPI0020C945D0|nr:ABC transporter permease subunit [Natronosalvus amylolyticus]